MTVPFNKLILKTEIQLITSPYTSTEATIGFKATFLILLIIAYNRLDLYYVDTHGSCLLSHTLQRGTHIQVHSHVTYICILLPKSLHFEKH